MSSLFRVSRRCHDGLVFLGLLAERYGSGAFLTVPQAASSSLSGAGYLEQIVGPLREAGMVEARRGPGGGYRLTRDPRTITIGEIVRLLEGPTALVECQAREGCPQKRGCGSRKMWNTLQGRINETLGTMTLAEIA
ncbi:hypothetical protein A3F28_01295 [Candidatus Uhrbacteria bacterium RIFCSPHIGHO2_12_FULL_57_11]|uniref:Rrf2 family transcriptional regulator n=2 Tax=Candidatus Uhriibacteriota TaxID=1752732 RepID=A0A1F7UPS2_9BACT|nr:MAG: hypothetical protein A3D72_00535 [Candidatus Uhrbacteria bacterium RIFCSPHIGHO2_02_FULL_57_19]OGL79697.1 MAG: hypothetical protein A3F28_01295 [Candidatus Uhrbacteria bacterium RIFCSPHIGHO2_12_FULL_57_11]